MKGKLLLATKMYCYYCKSEVNWTISINIASYMDISKLENVATHSETRASIQKNICFKITSHFAKMDSR